MGTYTYNLESVSGFAALYNSCVSLGIYDAVINIGDDIKVTTSSDESVVSNAVALSATDSLMSNKAIKIEEVEAKTASLMYEGAMFTRNSDGEVRGPLEVSFESRGKLRDLKTDVEDGFVPLPQLVSTIDGRGVQLNSITDIEAAYLAVLDRGVYLLNDGTNSDNSLGEAKLIIDILSTTNQTELDTVIDTRI